MVQEICEHGYDAAIYNMGRMYMNDFLHSMVRHGQIVPYDYDEAIRLESIAAGRICGCAVCAWKSLLEGGNPEEGSACLKPRLTKIMRRLRAF